jgi:hypothetical protein
MGLHVVSMRLRLKQSFISDTEWRAFRNPVLEGCKAVNAPVLTMLFYFRMLLALVPGRRQSGQRLLAHGSSLSVVSYTYLSFVRRKS